MPMSQPESEDGRPTIRLGPRAELLLDTLAEGNGLSRTQLVDEALRAFLYLALAREGGGNVFIQKVEGGPLEPVPFRLPRLFEDFGGGEPPENAV